MAGGRSAEGSAAWLLCPTRGDTDVGDSDQQADGARHDAGRYSQHPIRDHMGHKWAFPRGNQLCRNLQPGRLTTGGGSSAGIFLAVARSAQREGGDTLDLLD